MESKALTLVDKYGVRLGWLAFEGSGIQMLLLH